MFSKGTEAEACAYALEQYPNEACGIIYKGNFLPVDNLADDPTDAFQMPSDIFARYKVQGVVHSHNSERHGFWPSAADMQSQIETAVPWGLIWAGPEEATPILWWGEFTLDEPLLERDWVPGVYDCYSLLRAYYWQERKIKLPEIPRDDTWWKDGLDLFSEGFEAAGAAAVTGPHLLGDAVLMAIRSDVPNHCAIVLENGLILHHLAERLSRTEPLGPWERYIVKHLRYVR